MQNDKKNLNTRSRRVPSVEETTAAITAEQERKNEKKQQNRCSKATSLPPSKRRTNPVPSGTWKDPKAFLTILSKDQGKQPARSGLDEVYIPLVPPDCQETDDSAKMILKNLQRDRESRVQNHSLIIDDLKELGMFGELSEDHDYINMSFEDVHRLVTTMKMVNVILNERVQARWQAKLDDIKSQLDAKHCPNMQALFVELDRAKYELTQNLSFQSMGDFEGISSTLEGFILFETLLILRAMDWLASLSLDPTRS
jgi:hypothetical protein